MTETVHFSDVVCFLIAAMLVPLLTHRTIGRCPATRRYRGVIIIIGYFWLLYSFVYVWLVESLFGLQQVDAVVHEQTGRILALLMEDGRWSDIWEFIQPGNRAYQVGLGVIYYLADVDRAPVIINMMLAFWGSITLVSFLASHLQQGTVSLKWLLVITFPPSLVFWTTANLKEGPMYWAICMLFATAFGQQRQNPLFRWLKIGCAIAVGGLMRPHFMTVWCASILGTAILKRGRRNLAVLILLALPMLLIGVEKKTGFGLTLAGAGEYLESRYSTGATYKADIGSNIYRREGRPIFIISGAISLFLRPLIWNVRSLAQLMSALEIWGITSMLIWQWWHTSRKRRRQMWGMFSIPTAIFAASLFVLLFTWSGNVGTMARIRLQGLPAILTLLGIPWLLRHRPASVHRQSLN